jgi:hypothetical protein
MKFSTEDTAIKREEKRISSSWAEIIGNLPMEIVEFFRNRYCEFAPLGVKYIMI